MSFDDSYTYMKCINCNTIYEYNPFLLLCPKCRNLLEIKIENPSVSWSTWRRRHTGVWRYREALPVPSSVKPITLGEGGTPLVPVEDTRVYIKFEGSNPTGSFKDRGMTIGITIAKNLGTQVVIAASTGNTASSMAAYAARAGLRAVVVLPEKNISEGKLLQTVLHGAYIVRIRGSFDKAMYYTLEVVERLGKLVYPLNSFNPIRLEGQKTVAYEIVDQLGYVPDYVIVPVGNAGNIAAIWKGFKELYEWGLADKLPKMVGVQAEGASPLATAWSRGLEEPVWFEEPETIASAIRIGKPVNWRRAFIAVRESRGLFTTVGDSEILESQKIIARRVGLGVEPSSAAAFAGFLKLVDNRTIDRSSRVVVIATGHALKDPGSMKLHSASTIEVYSLDELARLLVGIAGG